MNVFVCLYLIFIPKSIQIACSVDFTTFVLSVYITGVRVKTNKNDGKQKKNILGRLVPGNKLISAERQDSLFRKEIEVNRLIKNSSPEFGFFKAIKTIITEKPFTPGALKNIEVLSEWEGEKTLIIRVYSVKSDSIDFEFYNKAELEHSDPNIFDIYLFDPNLLELKILINEEYFDRFYYVLKDQDSISRLYRIKLQEGGLIPEIRGGETGIFVEQN